MRIGTSVFYYNFYQYLYHRIIKIISGSRMYGLVVMCVLFHNSVCICESVCALFDCVRYHTWGKIRVNCKGEIKCVLLSLFVVELILEFESSV